MITAPVADIVLISGLAKDGPVVLVCNSFNYSHRSTTSTVDHALLLLYHQPG